MNKALTLIALVFALLLVFGLFGCNQTDTNNDSNSTGGTNTGGTVGNNTGTNGNAGTQWNTIPQPPALPE